LPAGLYMSVRATAAIDRHLTSRRLRTLATAFVVRATMADEDRAKVAAQLHVRQRDVLRPDGHMLYGLREWVVAPSASSRVVARATFRSRAMTAASLRDR